MEERYRVKMLRTEYICGISGMEDRFTGQWEWDQPLHAHSVISVIKAWNGFISVLIGRNALHRPSDEQDTTSNCLGNVLFCQLLIMF